MGVLYRMGCLTRKYRTKWLLLKSVSRKTATNNYNFSHSKDGNHCGKTNGRWLIIYAMLSRIWLEEIIILAWRDGMNIIKIIMISEVDSSPSNNWISQSNTPQSKHELLLNEFHKVSLEAFKNLFQGPWWNSHI